MATAQLNLHDAEDAFQPVFLLLARKAGAIRRRGSVASWLFAVARRLAWRARAGADRRCSHEIQVGAMPSNEPPTDDNELRLLLDEELGRLPDKYRTVLVLCCLQGRSRGEAARLLDWAPGAVKIRLERGRQLLRARLTRRGVALSLGALLAEYATTAGLPPALVDGTVRAAAALLSGQALAGTVSARALTLMYGMRKAMLLTHLKIATSVLLLAGLISAGAALLVESTVAAEPAIAPAAAPAPQPAAATDAHGDPLPPGARVRLGTARWRHESNPSFIGYMPDGKHVIAASSGGAIRKWEAASGKEVLLIETAGDGEAGTERVLPAGTELDRRFRAVPVRGDIHDMVDLPGADGYTPARSRNVEG